MDAMLKDARRYLKDCTKKEYQHLLDEALFTDRQEMILKYKKKDASIPTWEIANELQVSPETITRELKAIYKRILKLI